MAFGRVRSVCPCSESVAASAATGPVRPRQSRRLPFLGLRPWPAGVAGRTPVARCRAGYRNVTPRSRAGGNGRRADRPGDPGPFGNVLYRLLRAETYKAGLPMRNAFMDKRRRAGVRFRSLSPHATRKPDGQEQQGAVADARHSAWCVSQSHAEFRGCEAKKARIRQQIDYARMHDNTHREAGLRIALQRIEAHCTDASLLRKHEENIRKKEQEVEERREELLEAQASGKEDKIRSKARKLRKAQRELAEARRSCRGRREQREPDASPFASAGGTWSPRGRTPSALDRMVCLAAGAWTGVAARAGSGAPEMTRISASQPPDRCLR